MNSSAATIRGATEADLPDIASLLVDTWRTTFRGLLSDAFLDGISYERQRERHRRTMSRPESLYFIALNREETAAGFASAGPNRSPDSPYLSELYAIYVRREYQGRGIGEQLLGAVAEELVQRGRPSMVVWVLEVNPFRPFYARLGARPVDKQMITLGSVEVEQIAYAWADLRLIGSYS